MVGVRAAHAMNECVAEDRGRRDSCMSRSDDRERTEWSSARAVCGDVRALRTNLTFSAFRGSDAGHLDIFLSCRRQNTRDRRRRFSTLSACKWPGAAAGGILRRNARGGGRLVASIGQLDGPTSHCPYYQFTISLGTLCGFVRGGVWDIAK